MNSLFSLSWIAPTVTTGCAVPCQGCTTNVFWCWKELILTFWFDDELWRQIVPLSLAGSLFSDSLLFLLRYASMTLQSFHHGLCDVPLGCGWGISKGSDPGWLGMVFGFWVPVLGFWKCSLDTSYQPARTQWQCMELARRLSWYEYTGSGYPIGW